MIRKVVSLLTVALGSLLFFTTHLHAAVVLSTQPQPVNVLAGGVAVFTVNATGTGTLTYQWKQDGNPIPGATNAGLVLNPVVATNAGSYTVDVSDTTPGIVISDAATLTLRAPIPGDVDFSFAGGASMNSSISAVALQSDGKVVIGGAFTIVNSAARGHIARLNPDGSTDYSFGDGVAGASSTVSAVAVQSDGKVVIGGAFTSVNGVTHAGIARLNSDGTLDTTFGNGLAGVSGSVSAVAVQSDGKVVIGGAFTNINSTACTNIARLNNDGTLDTSFGNGLAGANSTVYAVALQSDGKVLISGDFTRVNGTARGNIARLNSDGTLDASFGNGLAGANSTVYAVALQSDGKVLIVGKYTTVNGTSCGHIARLNSDGTLDTNFGNGLSGTSGVVYTVAVQSDGKVLIGGVFTSINGSSNARGRIARLNSDGTLDTTFGNGLSGASGQVNAVVVQSNGQTLIGGTFPSVNGTTINYVARLNSNGALDTAFGNGLGGLNNSVTAVSLQSDGKVVIGGTFTTINGATNNRIARLNSDGTLDTTFGSGLAGASGSVSAVALQSDGKVVIGGAFTNVNGTVRTNIARLNSDGTLDSTFGNGLSGADNTVSVVALQSDGKVLIGGSFLTVNGTAISRIARLNSDGTLDSTFVSGLTGANGQVFAVALQGDGKVLVGGYFTSVSGTTRGSIARLNSDGTLDTTFGSGLTGVNGTVYAMVLQSDGKVLVGGAFTAVNGTSRNRIARLNSDGTLDSTFGNGLTGANGQVSAITLQSDGRVVIGGTFTTVNGSSNTRGRIARLNSDGTLDTSFGNGLTGAGSTVNAMAAQNDGKVVIGGLFTTINGTVRNYITRLWSPADSTNATLSALALSSGTLSPAFDPNTMSYTVNVPGSVTSLTITPTPADTTATVTVNGAGAATPVTLNVGNNLITVEVIAQDGVTKADYLVNVTRQNPNTPPTLTLPTSPLIAEATGPAGAIVSFTVSANDAEDGSLTPVVSLASGSTFPLGDTTVTAIATDSQSASVTNSFIVRVVDTTAPLITVPETLRAGTLDEGTAVKFSVSANDMVDGAVTATANPASGSVFPIGTNTVTVTAADAHSNSATNTFLVIVSGPPTLHITTVSNTVTVYWQNEPGWNLRETTSLPTTTTDWSDSQNVTLIGGTNYLTLTNAPGNRFYRLSFP